MNNSQSRMNTFLSKVADKSLETVVALFPGPTLGEQALATLATNIVADVIEKFIQDKLTTS